MKEKRFSSILKGLLLKQLRKKVSSKDIGEERVMHSRSDEIKKTRVMIKKMNLLKNFLNPFFLDIKLGFK